MNRFKKAVIIPNDSDLLCPIQIVRSELGKKAGLINPHKKPSRILLQNVDFIKNIRKGTLEKSQFPVTMTDSKGEFRKPADW